MRDIAHERGLLVIELLQLRIGLDQLPNDVSNQLMADQQSKQGDDQSQEEVHPIETLEDGDREKSDGDEVTTRQEGNDAHEAEGDVKARHQLLHERHALRGTSTPKSNAQTTTLGHLRLA